MKDFLKYISEKSPFYKSLWQNHSLDLERLPIIDQDLFWSANTWHDNKVLTEKIENGVVFRSGGTTGKAKFSAFTKKEWSEFTNIFGKSMENVLVKGDRVANLFYSGSLYASFLFIEKSLENCSTPTVSFPIAGSTELDEVIELIKNYDINVLAGVPTSLLRLAQALLDQNQTLRIDRLLYGGESLFDDQRDILQKVFQNPQIHSIGYASVDAGHLGGSLPKLGPRVHSVLNGTYMQIVDDDDKVINDTSSSGRLIVTNLTRTLMPIIRYPVGDMARWVVVGESFEVLGRSDEGARIGPVTITRDDIVCAISERLAFQFVLKRVDGKDKLEIHYQGQLDKLKAKHQLLLKRKMLNDCVEQGIVHAPEFVEVADLECNKRTGKLRLVIDKRF